VTSRGSSRLVGGRKNIINWITTGFLLLRLWSRAVGIREALSGCMWVVVRKALPNRKALAEAMMPPLRTLKLDIAGHAYPFYARWPASDLHILYTIIERKEYAPIAGYLDGAADIVFLDLGANIGAASRYVLETFPRARVIAVEPDAGNIAMCHMNLDPYGARARVVHAAVWNKNGRLVFENETTQIGMEAGVRVLEPGSVEDLAHSVEGVDIPTLISEACIAPESQIALKIDVEGSEKEIFSGPSLDWLDEISCIAIELHDSIGKKCSDSFYAAVEGRLLEPPRQINDTVFVGLKGRLSALELASRHDAKGAAL